MESQSRTVNGLTMRWEEAGAGFSLVLIHGILTSPAVWRHVVPKIRGARCMAWEMVGYGASIPQGEDRDIAVARQADHLVEWLGALGIDRAILAGHDLGGGVAQIVAVRHPELCAGLFLTNAIGYDSWPIPSLKAMQKGRALVRRMPDAAIRTTMATLYRRGHDKADQARAALDAHWPHYRRNGAGEALARQAAALDVNDTLAIAEALPALDIPARIVWGAADRFQKIKYGERLARDLKAPLTRVGGGKHFTPEDHPDTVADGLNDLLDEVQRRHPGATQPRPDATDDGLADARAALSSLPEIMQDEAGADVREIYDDIQNVLRAPFVNFLFRVMASDPDYLKRAWAQLRPVARSQAFEDAASELRALARTGPAPSEGGGDWGRDGDLDRIRAFTESIDYVLPKLLLIALLLDRAPSAEGSVGEATISLGVPDGAEKIPMVDPETADDDLRRLFEDIGARHGHPKVATYFRSLGQRPDVLARIWERLRPRVGDAGYVAARESLIGEAERRVQALPAPDLAASGALGQAIGFFHRRLIPDLMLDAEMVRTMLTDGSPAPRNWFDVSSGLSDAD